LRKGERETKTKREKDILRKGERETERQIERKEERKILGEKTCFRVGV
jgi:hypothetical protein